MAHGALVLPEEDMPVYVFLPLGPRHHAYGFMEGYRDSLGHAAGDWGCWKELGKLDIDAKVLAAGDARVRSRGIGILLEAVMIEANLNNLDLLLGFALCNP
jgi:hypothetical protein